VPYLLHGGNMANEISYGLKFNTKDMERLIKLAERLDKISNEMIKDFSQGERKKTETVSSEIKKREQYLRKQKAWEKQLRNIDLANEKKYQADVTRNQKDEQSKRNNITKQNSYKSNVMNVPLRVGKYLATSTAIYGGIGAIKSGVGAIKEYEKSLSSAYSALGNVTESQKELIRNLTTGQYLVNNYAISSEDAARGINVLAKSGLSAAESIKVLEPALQLSAAGDIDLEMATESLVKTLNGFGLEMNQAGKITDYFAYSAAKSVTDIKELSDAMRVAAPSAKVFKQDVEDTFSVLSAFAQAGVKSAAAGNAYDRILKRLTKSQKEVKDGLQKYNIKVFLDENGKATEKQTNKLRNLSDIMTDMEKSGLMQNFADAQKILGQYTFKNAAQLSSVVSLLPEYKKGIEEASGAAKEMANIKLDNLAGELQKLEANWKNTFTGKDGIGNTLKDATFSLNEFIQLLNKLTNQGQGRSPLSWYTDIFKNANKEIEKTQRMLGQIQDSTLDFGLGDNAKSQRRVEFLSGLSDKELNDKIKGYKRNISIFAESVKKEEQKLKDSPFFANRTKIKEDKKVLEEQYAYLAYASALERKRRLDIPAAAQSTKVTPPLLDVDGGNKTPKNQKSQYDNLEAFLLSLEKLRNKYSERELTGLEKTQAEINNTYDEKLTELENKNINYYVDLQTQRKIQNDRDKSLIEAKSKWELDEAYRVWKEKLKIASDNADKEYKLAQDRIAKLREIKGEYGTLGDKQSLLDEERDNLLNSAYITGQMKENIEKDFAQRKIDLAYETWAKEHEFAMAAFDGIKAGSSSLGNALSDDMQISKAEASDMWNSTKSVAINALWAVAEKKIAAMAMELVFGQTAKAAETTAAVTAMTAQGTAAGVAAVPMAIYAASLNAAAIGLSGITAGTSMLASASATSIAAAANVAYMASLQVGFPVADAVVADGKVYPYRKDDLVMIGTNLDNRSGATLPTQSMVNGGGGSRNDNSALISELRSLRLTVARSDANNVKAITDNTPVVQGTMMDNVKIYKASEIGKRKANFIVNPT